MEENFDKEKVLEKMRELKEKRRYEIENNVKNPQINVVNVIYLGKIEWNIENDKNIENKKDENKKEYKGIYLEIEEKKDKKGNIIQIERYYTEDGEFIGGNNKSDQYNMILLKDEYKEQKELIEKLNQMDEKEILDLNKMEKEEIEKVAKILEINPEDIDELARIDGKEIERAKKELDEKDKDEDEDSKSEDEKENNKNKSKDGKEIISKKEIEKISSKAEISPTQKVTENKTMESLLNVKDENYKSIYVVDSEKLEKNNNTTRFSFVGIKEDGTPEKIDSLKQIGGVTPNNKVYEMNYDGSQIQEANQSSIYNIQGSGDYQLAVRFGSMGTIETSLLRTPRNDKKQAISIPIRNNHDLTDTRAEAQRFMSVGRNYSMNEEIERIEKHEKSDCKEKLTMQDIDDNPYNDKNNHKETRGEDVAYEKNGKIYTYKDFAERWGLREGKEPDIEKIEKKIKEYEKAGKDVFDEGDNEFENKEREHNRLHR